TGRRGGDGPRGPPRGPHGPALGALLRHGRSPSGRPRGGAAAGGTPRRTDRPEADGTRPAAGRAGGAGGSGAGGGTVGRGRRTTAASARRPVPGRAPRGAS